MRAAVLRGKHRMEVTDWQTPGLKPDEVRIRVKSCGICGTDQHIYHGNPGSAAVTPPIVLGHELAGEVVETGAAVTSLSPGDRVSVDPNIYCGGCRYCRGGSRIVRPAGSVGVTRDGGMGELCTAPASNCYRIPDEMSFAEAAMVEPLGCVLHGFRKIDVRPVHTVLIIGGGFIGQLFLQLVNMQGAAKIIVSEPVKEKHRQLLELGATEAVSPADPGAAAALQNAADVVIECVGRKESMELAFHAAAKGGQVLLFGVASPDTQIAVEPFAIFAKELRVTGSFINPHTHEDAIALIRSKIVQVEPLISHRFSLEDVPDIMARYPQMNVTKGVILY
ncbi:theronine dehydrogenase [Gordoniibacillus kamchatkensis]|uniref:Theronine dehydrogenase n=1 Tax=Gordoniibacillus kamchatkensis TaxID=1590651 RepID=A0ABR5AH42_9BACL|nr:zinc-dependent alcohol dehydrogenase family protein [Paenibacillus sp. VKM B-2647]KIL40281.1 theronine dehydrogenase [Paenibacillus sp. VKM B-2647]